ncbi:GrpB family protein [Bacillus tropicus]|nr:GrpB family protein [Bacillus tropicus]
MLVVRDINRIDEFNTSMVASGYKSKGEYGISQRRYL